MSDFFMGRDRYVLNRFHMKAESVHYKECMYIYTGSVSDIFIYLYVQYMFVARCKVIPRATGGGPLI